MENRVKKILIFEFAISILLIFITLFYDLSSLYIFKIRVIKIFAIILFSINISVATIVFQVISNNLIITPSILGMNSLYLTIHTAIVFFLGIFSVFNTNILIGYILDLVIMGIFSTLVYRTLFKMTKFNILYILLIGVILSQFFSSLQETMVRLIDPNDYQNLLSILTPGITNISLEVLIISYIFSIVIIIYSIKHLKKLDVIQLSKERAINLGIDYDKDVNYLLFLTCILTAISTAIVGNLIFLGLVISNISRYLLNYKTKNLIISSVFLGIIILILSDFISHKIFLNNIPLNVFIDLLGGIYFIYLFVDKNRLSKGRT